MSKSPLNTAIRIVYSIYTQEAGLVNQYNKSTSTHTDHIRVAGITIARVESRGSYADPANHAFNAPMDFSGIPSNLVDRPHYLPFGKSIDGLPQKENTKSFTGHAEDSSGLVYMQARYYDPV